MIENITGIAEKSAVPFPSVKFSNPLDERFNIN